MLEPQRCISAVKAAGDAAVIRIVLGDIRIEQQDRHRTTCRTLQNVQPGADPDPPLCDRHGHHGGQDEPKAADPMDPLNQPGDRLRLVPAGDSPLD